jgi:hypothetical protein
MSLQDRACRIVRDVIGIVLDWNTQQISDKDAMKEITRSLLIDKEEKKEEIVEVKKDKKLFQNFKFGKKLVPPLIISGFFILVVVGIVNPYEVISNFEVNTSTEEKLIQLREIPTDDRAKQTEQFLEIPSEAIVKIKNGSEVVLEP